MKVKFGTAPGVLEKVIDPRFHLAAIVSSSADPILSKDLGGNILSWNEAATRLFGYEADEIIGQSIYILVPRERHHEEDAVLRKIRAGDRIEPFETVRVAKNGKRIPVSMRISPIKDPSGAVSGASTMIHDLSERERNEESRFQLAAIVDSADDAIVSKDLNGIVKTWNAGAQRIFGYTAEEMIGQPILRLFPKELYYEEDEILRKLRGGERIDHYETTRVRKNGEAFEVSVTISPIRDNSGRVIAASKIARDISDRKRFERLLLQSEKLAATGRMAAAIAHEINNPLESVINLVYLARLNCSSESKAQQHLLVAETELERVSHIARQTLGYYRDTTSPVEIQLHTLIENVLAVYQSRLHANSISVDTQFNDLQKIVVSKGEMLQVFSNIIANALDAMREGGNLKISTRNVIGAAGDGVQIQIRDNGTGIHPEHLDRIFEPFFTTKGDLGTGIGLWVARQLIEKRGGQISLASNTEGPTCGTIVTIFIPFAAPATALNAHPQ
ncbi:MAG TPA: PAS domain S-box protein [Terracidiphilus sp.]|nr:PAS domain S-box protein [Terracidiphilus sp.]